MIQTLDGENKSLILRSNHASKEFLAKLQHMRQQDQFTDVILTTEDGKQVKAHKIVLCCSSNYFEVMFCGQFCENPQSEIHLKEIFYNPLNQIIDYFYTGILKITLDNCQELLQLSDLLLLSETKKHILKYFRQTLNTTNCILYQRIGQMYCDGDLSEASQKFFSRNYEIVCESEDFKDLTFEELCDFYTHFGNSIIVQSEDIVLKSIVLWIQHEKKIRENYVKELSRFVHWNQVSGETFETFKQNYPTGILSGLVVLCSFIYKKT